jgi:hypothetical protein
MKIEADKIEAHLQKLVNANVSGLDIMHGELKNLMLIAEQEFNEIAAEEEADDYSDAMLSMERTRAEGYLDALCTLYALTYDLSFAIAEKEGIDNGNA